MPTNGAITPPSAVDEQVAAQHRGRGDGAEAHAPERERDQRDDHERVEDDGGEDRAARAVEAHHVERVERRERAGEHRRDDREVLRHVVRDREGRQRAAGDQHLLADLDDVDQLRRIRVEVDHVAGLLRRLRAGVHRHADVRLRERRGVVGAVTGHRDEVATRLLALDQRHLVLGRRLGEEVVDTRLVGDRLRRQGVVARDHHGADAHPAQLLEALADALLDDVLEVHDAQCTAVLGHDERRAAGRGDLVDRCAELRRDRPSCLLDPALHRVCGALADVASVDLDPAHARLGGELDHVRAVQVAASQREALLRQNDDRAPLRRLVGQARELRCVGQLLLADARSGNEVRRLPVAERDRAGLVEQQRRAVARSFDRAAAEREDVALHEPVHAGDADRGEQRADRRRDQAHEQRHEHDHGLLRARVDRERLERDDGEQQDDRQAREQDVECDLVRRLLAAGALDEGDHAVEEALSGPRRHAHHDLVREDARAAGDGAAIAAGLADHGCRLAGDGRLVDGGDAFDHVAVAGDHLAGGHDDHVAHLELRARRRPRASRRLGGAGPWSPRASCAAWRPVPCRGLPPSPRRSSRTRP